MRTLSEIVEMAKDGKTPEYDELRYAVCALEALLTFDSMAIRRLAETKMNGKKQILSGDPEWAYKESFERVKRAFTKSPKEWLGPNNDPDDPEVQERRKVFKKLADKLIDKVLK